MNNQLYEEAKSLYTTLLFYYDIRCVPNPIYRGTRKGKQLFSLMQKAHKRMIRRQFYEDPLYYEAWELVSYLRTMLFADKAYTTAQYNRINRVLAKANKRLERRKRQCSVIVILIIFFAG